MSRHGKPRPMRSTACGSWAPRTRRRSRSRGPGSSTSCERNDAASPSAVAVSSTFCRACPAPTSAARPLRCEVSTTTAGRSSNVAVATEESPKSRSTHRAGGWGSGPPAVAGTPSPRPAVTAVHRLSSATNAGSASWALCAATASSATCTRSVGSSTTCSQAPSSRAARCSAVSSPAVTGASANGRRLVCRRGTAASRRSSSGLGGRSPPRRTSAMRSGRARSGSTVTMGRTPNPRRASRSVRSAAPQAIRCSRPSGSAAASTRSGSAHSSITSGPTRNRHGWLLCSEGARHAAVSAVPSLPGSRPSARVSGSIVGSFAGERSVGGWIAVSTVEPRRRAGATAQARLRPTYRGRRLRGRAPPRPVTSTRRWR